MTAAVLLLSALLAMQQPAASNDDPVARARTLAIAGQRAEAVAILESRLIAHPEDDDARTLLGTVLAWQQQFARARTELNAVLAHDPNNADARAALANVERWSHAPAALPNEAQAGFRLDGYEDAPDWREAMVSLRHRTRAATFLGRVAHATRGGASDTQFEAEAYPRLTDRAYLYAAAAAATEHSLYPRLRLGAEWFQGFGTGWEASLGDRWLHFDDDVNVLTASISKYSGNWLFTARGFHADTGDTSGFLGARRYFGDGGTEYVGIRAGRGSARDELRSTSDLALLRSREIAFETRLNLGARATAEARAAIGKGGGEARVSVEAMLGWRF
ncbi:MAG: YaiO family outer membrane beta-barrel protein [Acidobacteriota bacterium]|nr:YaiO family outer membrane beta-barrel protein [Acidobacteriota bacterium]